MTSGLTWPRRGRRSTWRSISLLVLLLAAAVGAIAPGEAAKRADDKRGATGAREAVARVEPRGAAVPKVVPVPAGRFRFVCLGDSRDGNRFFARLLEMAKRTADPGVSFVVHLGDIIGLPSKQSEWTDYDKLVARVGLTIFPVTGNHDVSSKEGRDGFLAHNPTVPGPDLYYAFDAGPVRFIVLDAQTGGGYGKIVGKQLAWLVSLLERSADRPFLFIAVHQPLYPDQKIGKHWKSCLDAHPRERDQLAALFRKHRVSAVFAGHDHLYLRSEIDGLTQVITGGAGSPLYSKDKTHGFYHLVLGDATDKRVEFKVLDIEGEERDRFTVSARTGVGEKSSPPKRGTPRSAGSKRP